MFLHHVPNSYELDNKARSSLRQRTGNQQKVQSEHSGTLTQSSSTQSQLQASKETEWKNT